MAQQLRVGERGSVLAGWVFSVVVAVLVSYGTAAFLDFHGKIAARAAQPVVTHSTPVGGEIEDGVFRSSPPPDTDPDVSRWRI